MNVKLTSLNLRNRRAWTGMCVATMSTKRLRFRISKPRPLESESLFIQGIVTFRSVRPR